MRHARPRARGEHAGRRRPRAAARGPAAHRRAAGGARAARAAAGLLPVPWAETALAARVDGIEFHNVHVPNAANGEIKPQTLAAVRAGLEARAGPRVLCGDLNTPRRESPDGTVWSFARDGRGRLREDRAGFWDEAELGVVPGLRELGFADAFRALHGTHRASRAGRGGRSPATPAAGGWTTASARPSCASTACAYHHGWRDSGLSDHSALEAELTQRSSSQMEVR